LPSLKFYSPNYSIISQSAEKLSALKARLSDLAHAYCGATVDIGNFLMHKECLKTIRSLRKSTNSSIIITKSDKGSGEVILNKNDYVSKTESILHDETKFETLGSSTNNNNTKKLESGIQHRLLQLNKDNLHPSRVYKMIRPTGFLRPRMYGLLKTHKKGIPLQLILSMIGSSRY